MGEMKREEVADDDSVAENQSQKQLFAFPVFTLSLSSSSCSLF